MSANKDAAKAEAWMQESFGTTFHAYQKGLYGRDLGVHVSNAVRIFAKAGLTADLAKWRLSDQKSAAGAKAIISPAAALIIMMTHMQEGRGLYFTQMAETLTHRFEPADFTAVGVHKHDGDYSDWYERLWRAVQALMKLIDPLPGNRHRTPNATQYQAIRAARDPEDQEKKQLRLDHVCARLVHATTEILPRELRRRYKGNIAVDATFIALSGKRGNPHPDDEHLDRRTANYDGGAYVRSGNHDGEDKSLLGKRLHVLEVEFATMVPNAPNTPTDFPLLVTGIRCHRPGAIKLEGKKILETHVSLGFPPGMVLVDLAYAPNSVPEDFQGPARNLGFSLVFGYRRDQVGQTAYHGDAIQVEGQWYLNIMPLDLVNAEVDYQAIRKATKYPKDVTAARKVELTAERAAASSVRYDRLAMRDAYRFKPKGLPNKSNQSQRFLYPDPEGYLAVNTLTGEMLPPITTKTLTIPGDVGLKYGQELTYLSDEWKANYGMRSIVEGQNSYVKDPAYEALEVAGRRRARGNTFAYLAAAMAVVSANLRKIYTFLRQAASDKPLTAKTRAKRVIVPEWVTAIPEVALGNPPPPD